MSLHGYHVSVLVAQKDLPFESLIMAAMRKADTDNLTALQAAFPATWRELQARYNAPAGVIPEDGDIDLNVLSQHLAVLRKQGI